ncbi:uncharacterized protein LOC126858764 [Cataglyphis hispanica]|uniref:uncharacterized protein LOC126858764 n=1 Tax=Cataglyphis hispanica TaxID=1086592 RepID=UPI00217F2D57|nr:uncharacterized protein LOC126858764 [Cataglyphis hispanica]
MTTARKINWVRPPVTDIIYSNDFETDVTTINLTNNFPEKIIPSPDGFVKTDAHSSFISGENVRYVQPLKDNIDSNPCAQKQEIYIDKNKKYSPYVRQLIKVPNFERIQIHPQNRQSNALKERLTSVANINSTRLNLDINNCGVTEKLLEFDENVNETNTRYEMQSMVSSSMSKDVPTTPAVNSFEQKTPSETFLSLDRISTQPINKNTPTNKSEAPRNDGDINVFKLKRNPSFSEKEQENKQFVSRKINSQPIRESQKETNLNHRLFSLIENIVEITPRRGDPLQVSTRNKRMNAPIVSQKDILNKNSEEAEYKNNTTKKKNTKPSLQNDQSEVTVKEKRKGSTNKNATKDSTYAITATPPMKKISFRPKSFTVRFKSRKEERNSTRTGKFQNFNRFSSSHFQHFYDAKKDLLAKINNITVVGKIKSTRFEFLSDASQAYLSRKKKEKALKNPKARDHVLDIRMSNVSALNDSISVNKNDSSEYSASNLQNASLVSNKIVSHLNMSSQEIEKSIQTKAVYNNDTAPLTLENNSKVSSEAIVQKITENLKQLSDINRGNAQKYFSTKSPTDNQ